MKKEITENYTLEDLLKLEKASRLICMKYENSTKNYDGSIANNDEYTLFKKYNDFHNGILVKIEKLLDKEIAKK